MLTLKGIEKSFGEGAGRVTVLKNINMEIRDGSFCVLLGPSGSGKSTLLNIIGGIDTCDAGEISIDGRAMSDMNEKELTRYRRKHLGYIFQMYNLIPNLTVRENIEVGAYLSDQPLDLDELLQTLGLWEHQDKLPNQLSGGQQQRTSIGRTVIKNPDILLCDEPTGALKTLGSASQPLQEGYGKIQEGVQELYDGLKEFNDEAIREMARTGGYDLASLLGSVRQLRRNDGNYKTYSGLTSGTEGSVRFIFETAEIRP